DELEAAIQVELDSLVKSGPSADEMKATKTIVQTQNISGLEGLGALADRLNLYNHYTGDPNYLNKDLARYDAVNAKDVQAFAATHLARDHRVVVQVLPGPKVLPPAPPTPAQVAAKPSTVESKEPWRNHVPEAKAVSTSPLPAATRFQLDNGLNVYLVESHVLPVV